MATLANSQIPVWRGIDPRWARDRPGIAPRGTRRSAPIGMALEIAMTPTAAMTDAPPSVDARIGPVTKTASFTVAATPSARGSRSMATVSFRIARSTPTSAPLTTPARLAATTSTTSEASAASARARPTNAAVRTVARSLANPVAENRLPVAAIGTDPRTSAPVIAATISAPPLTSPCDSVASPKVIGAIDNGIATAAFAAIQRPNLGGSSPGAAPESPQRPRAPPASRSRPPVATQGRHRAAPGH